MASVSASWHRLIHRIADDHHAWLASKGGEQRKVFLAPVSSLESGIHLPKHGHRQQGLVRCASRRRRRSGRSFVADDVVIQKLVSIDRCLRAIRTYVAGDLGRLAEPIVLDAVVRTVVEHRLGDFEALCRELSADA
jgi:hypothetical protein